MWDKRIQAKGKARQDNQAKKAKAKGKEFLSTYNKRIFLLSKLMVLLLHWFIPYKVERGKRSFECGTKEFKPKARQANQAKKAKAKGKEFLSTYNNKN